MNDKSNQAVEECSDVIGLTLPGLDANICPMAPGQ